MIYRVEDFYKQSKNSLNLKVLSKTISLKKIINKLEIQTPSFALAGFLKNYKPDRILVFGSLEMQYLNTLNSNLKIKSLEKVVTKDTPCMILANNFKSLKEIEKLAEKKDIPIFKSDLDSFDIVKQATFLLRDVFLPTINLPGTFLEIFDVGVLIQGESSIGKSETALKLIRKGHKFVSDDVVQIRKKDSILIGSPSEKAKYLMEIRNIGIIDVAKLFGEIAIRSKKRLDIVINLEGKDDLSFSQRGIIEQKYIDILGIKTPYHSIFVNLKRDISLLIETISLNLRSKSRGYNIKNDFSQKLLEKIAKREKAFHETCENLES